MIRLSTARAALTIAVCLAGVPGSLLYTARTLVFETSSIQLPPPMRLYVQRFKEDLQEFGELNDMVVVEAPSVERAQACADRLAGEIKALPGAGRVSPPVPVPAAERRASDRHLRSLSHSEAILDLESPTDGRVATARPCGRDPPECAACNGRARLLG